MLPIERQNQIKVLLQKKKMIKVSELSELLNVSEMTIYRDIKPLVDEGFITKTSRGISLNEKPSKTALDQHNCVYCHKPNSSQLVYRLILTNNVIETACCAHCGLLRYHQLGDSVVHAICHDFLMNTTISASSAYYVMGTTLNVACCQPQVLTFEDSRNAKKFVAGFGGEIYGFKDAMEKVYQKMHNASACCSSDKIID